MQTRCLTGNQLDRQAIKEKSAKQTVRMIQRWSDDAKASSTISSLASHEQHPRLSYGESWPRLIHMADLCAVAGEQTVEG